MSEAMFAIGRNVRRLREERGISLSALARRAGISKAYLSQLENDPAKKPSAEIVYHLARALEVSMTELLGLEDGTAAAADHDALPPGLRLFWHEHPEIPLEDIRLLAAVGRRAPGLTPTDFWLVYETIRLVTRRRPGA